MKLTPKLPPGRSTRKARAFGPEIWQLRAQGYTFEAIREALATAGVAVANSTVQRELTRYLKRKEPSAATSAGESPISTPPPSALVATPLISVSTDVRTGKEIAESFMRNRISNPLVRAKEHR